MKCDERSWQSILFAQIIGVVQRLDQNLKCSMCLSHRHPKSVIHNGYYMFFEVMYYSLIFQFTANLDAMLFRVETDKNDFGVERPNFDSSANYMELLAE